MSDAATLMGFALACPRCGEALSDEPAGYGCADCELTFPPLGGIPLLVPDPEGWAARFRESALASLAEVGRADAETVSRLNELALGVGVETERFGDDWTLAESLGEPPPSPVLQEGAWHSFLDGARRRTPVHVALELLGDELGPTVELGPGAGLLTTELAERTSDLVVVDLSLRALLLTTSKAACTPALMDADYPAFAGESVGSVVGLNVVDLSDDPASLVEQWRRVLRPGGRFVLGTPDPSLGTGDDRVLAGLLEDVGFEEVEVVDQIPWLRELSSRHTEVYAVQLVAGRKPG